jgi:integrase/recombinase XerC
MFRHARAAHLLNGGADLRVVQENLGQEKADPTAIYLHVTPARPRETYNAAQGWIEGERAGRRR